MSPGSSSWLAQLAPAHAPPAPGAWPPAPGWWILALLLLAALGALLRWQLSRPRCLRRQALHELQGLRAAHRAAAEDTGDGSAGGQAASAEAIAALAAALESLLRRYALAVFGATQVARLSGEAWLRFAAAQGAAPLGSAAGHALLSAAFGGSAGARAIDQALPARWLRAAESFIRRARAPRALAGSQRTAARGTA